MKRLLLALAWLAMLLPQGAEAQRARQGLLSLEDARIFYEVLGTGEPIIVVHGGPGLDHGYLQPGMDALSGRNTLVYYDQRGTGRSSAELDSTAINVDAFVDDIEALRQALEFDEVTVLTHSFGSRFGLEYARRYPDRLRALILMNPVDPGTRFAGASATRQEAARTPEDQEELTRLMATEGFAAQDPATLSAVYRVAFRGTFRDRSRVDELDFQLPATTARNGQEVGRLLGLSMGDGEWWDRLPGIRVPTLILHGRYDIPPVAMAEALGDAMPNATVSILESGHFPYIEDADGLASAVAGFFVGLNR